MRSIIFYGAAEWQGEKLGLFQLLRDDGEEGRYYQLLPEGGRKGPVYRQLHDGNNQQIYLYRWDMLQINVCHTAAIECILGPEKTSKLTFLGHRFFFAVKCLLY